MANTKLPRTKRHRADWMVPTDDHILEELHDTGNLQPSEVTFRILSTNRKYVGTRMRELSRFGLTDNLGSGTYRITATGVGYLNGEYDASELETHDDD